MFGERGELGMLDPSPCTSQDQDREAVSPVAYVCPQARIGNEVEEGIELMILDNVPEEGRCCLISRDTSRHDYAEPTVHTCYSVSGFGKDGICINIAMASERIAA